MGCASHKAPFVASVVLCAFLLACGGGGGLGPPAPRPSVSVSPRSANVLVEQSAQFTAILVAISSSGLTWSVNGIAGGDGTVGTIDANGVYTAPAVPPSPNTLTVSATTATSPSTTGTASVSILNPVPAADSLSPSVADAGSGDTTLVVRGSGFTPQSTAIAGATALATTVNSSTKLTATVPASMLETAGILPVSVRTPQPGGGTSNAINLNVLIAVAVSPASSNLIVGQTLLFSATVTGSSNQNVTWSVNGIAGGDSTVGTIDSSGLYTAPLIPNDVTVTATSAADTSRTASASVATVNPVPSINSLSPASLNVGSTDSTLTVNGSGFAQQSVVKMSGASLATTYVTSTRLTAALPANQLATAGAFAVTVANPAPGGGTSSGVTFSVNQAPSITSANSATFMAGNASSFTVTTSGFPVPTLSESGALPSGVTFNSATGVLNGTPAVGTGGVYTISFKAANGVGTDATQNFTLTVNQAPAITSANSTAFTVGSAGSFPVTATGFPTPTLSETGTLPSGVTFNASTGVLSGTPAAGTGGTYNISLKASNGIGTDTLQNLALTVNQAPAVTSAASASFVVGSASSFTVTATGFPTPTLSKTGALPSGVGFNPATGVLSGTPAAGTGGTYSLSFKASNGVGTDATQNFTLAINQAPAITSASSTAFTVGSAGSFPVTATGFPTPTLSETGVLPTGVTFNASTGTLGGTPAAGTGGTYSLSFKASNGIGTDATQSFTLTVNQAPAITSGDNTTFTVGTAGSFTLTATGFPTPTLSKTGTLPSGVTFNEATGVLSGTPAANMGGNYTLTFTASNGEPPDATQSFTLTVNQTPAITSTDNTTFTVGTAGSFTVTATGFPTPTLSETGTLPSGVTFNASTGVLSGTPGSNAGGTYSITFTAANGASPDSSQNFVLTVENPEPVLYSVSPPGATTGDGNTTLTLSGSGFTRQSVVSADATALATSYVNSTQIRGTMPSSMLTSAGTMTITVVTDSPGGGPSSGVTFRIWPSYPRSDATTILNGPPPALQQLPQTGTLVSVLDWTSKDNIGTPEDVLAADHLLTELGIPNIDTTNVSDATGNSFLLVAGVLNTAADLSQPEVNQLKSYVNGGGTLYLWEPNVTSLLTALGVGAAADHSGAAVRPLTFDVSKTDPLLTYIDASEEINWQPSFPSDDVTRGYSAGTCTPLATWSTGDYAALRCDIGSGRAYVFGWRLRPLLTLAERGLEGPDVQWTNVPVLDADICRMLMRGSYENYALNPQERQWAPEGHHAAIILTHDVDATISYQNVPAWVDFEESLGVKSTFLFTTTPYDTNYIEAMFTPSGRMDIQYAVDHGFDVQDHSFGHFPDFYVAPYSIGPPTEDASNYLPTFTSNPPGSLDCCTSGMSVLGEAGVSKWLLENDLGISVQTFRAGYLDNPPDLVRGLSDIGYRRDSTSALALARGSFPFVLFDVDDATSTVTTYRLMEYPVIISEDQDPPLDSTTINDYLSKWENIIRINYNNNAPTVLLIHPIDTGVRFQILQQLLTDLQNQGMDVWVGDMKTFADFWEAQGVTNARWP